MHYRVAFVVEGALVEVPRFGLQQEEKQVALLVGGARRHQEAPGRGVALAAGQRRAHFVVALVLVRHPVLPDNQNPTGPVGATGDCQQHAGGAAHCLRPFPHHVVQAQVQLVVGQVLLGLFGRFTRRVQVRVPVVQLQRRKDL